MTHPPPSFMGDGGGLQNTRTRVQRYTGIRSVPEYYLHRKYGRVRVWMSNRRISYSPHQPSLYPKSLVYICTHLPHIVTVFLCVERKRRPSFPTYVRVSPISTATPVAAVPCLASPLFLFVPSEQDRCVDDEEVKDRAPTLT